MSDYPPPVDALLTYGVSEGPWQDEWPDYPAALGLGPEHVPDLIRMATDRELRRGEPESPRVWASVHAWRALGQLRVEGAVGPLLGLLVAGDEEDDDWVMEELPIVFGMIGPAAIPALAQFLADETKPRYSRTAVADALQHMAEDHPQARDECVAVLTRQLESAERNDPTLNGFLMAYLLDLEAVESAPVIERAFATDNVDEMIAGGWEDVRHELGLGPPPPPRKPWFGVESIAGPPAETFAGPSPLGEVPRPSPQRKAKAKRKQAKKSRKHNRKRR
jgi:hypothetical protein